MDTNRIIFKENQRSPCEDKPPLLPRLPAYACKVKVRTKDKTNERRKGDLEKMIKCMIRK